MSAAFTESIVEDAALAWLSDLGYTVAFGPTIAPGEPAAERDDYAQVVLARHLCHALVSRLISGELRMPNADSSVESLV